MSDNNDEIKVGRVKDLEITLFTMGYSQEKSEEIIEIAERENDEC